MQTIILNYNDGKAYTLNHDESFQVEDIEEIITERYNFSLNEVEWMTVETLQFESLN